MKFQIVKRKNAWLDRLFSRYLIEYLKSRELVSSEASIMKESKFSYAIMIFNPRHFIIFCFYKVILPVELSSTYWGWVKISPENWITNMWYVYIVEFQKIGGNYIPLNFLKFHYINISHVCDPIFRRNFHPTSISNRWFYR